MSVRTVTDKQGVTWEERDIGPGRVERTRISPGGDIIRGGGTATLIEGSRSRSSTSTTAPVEIPELRADATPKITVKLGGGARRAIKDELRRDGLIEVCPGLETGGCLIAQFRSRREVWVMDATWPGDGARRGYEQVRISEALGDAVEAQIVRNYNEEARMVGCWHSHPVRVTTPSGPDRANALAYFDRVRMDRWLPFAIDMIVTPARGGDWWHPDVHAWVTRRSRAGTPYTEPAILEGRL